MADFKIAYVKTSNFEGGYANVKGDRGGETYAGITRKYFPKWAGWKIVDDYKRKYGIKHGQRLKNVKLEELIKAFYKKEFWDVISGDEIEDQGTANRLYDFGVNAGYGRSIKQLQEVLGLPATGKVTDQLIDAINNPAKYLL